VVVLLNRPKNIKDSIIAGILIGLLAGVLLSIFYLGPMVFATVFFIIFSMVGALISYFLFEKTIKNKKNTIVLNHISFYHIILCQDQGG